MTTNEPTTDEIVRDLRLKTKYGMELMKGHFSEKDFVTTIAADRLESQEQTIAVMKEFHEKCCGEMARAHVEEVTALTARAEQAERERDAAIKDLKAYPNCFTCKHDGKSEEETLCDECWGMGVDMAYEWRGLPQDGDGE